MDTQKSIDLLNKGAADELQAVHQYMYWHFHLADQGLNPLSNLFKRIAIFEMGHVERFAERILFLKGDVKMVLAAPVEPIREPAEILARAAQMEKDSARDYNQFALQCSANADAASKQIFEDLVKDEEGHFDIFDKQLEHIRRYGPNYLALQSFQSSIGSGGEAEAAAE